MVRRWREAAALGLLACLATWLLGMRLALEYDEGVYAETERLLSSGHALVSDIFSSQPPLFPFTLIGGWWAGGATGTRVAVALWSVVALGAVYRLARGYLGPRGATAVVVLLAATPGFQLVATEIEAEIPSLALALLALALVSRRVAGAAPPVALWRPAAAGALFGLAMMTKLLVAPLAAVVLVALVVAPGTWRAKLARLALFAGGFVVVVIAVAAPFWNDGALYDQVIGFHVAAQSFLSGVAENIKTAGRARISLAVLAVGLIALGWLLARRRADPVLAVWFAVTVGFLVLHAPLFVHHLVLALVPATILTVVALRDVGSLPGLRPAAEGVVVGGAVLLLLGSYYHDVHGNKLLTARTSPAVAALQKLPRGTVVVTDDQTVATAAGLSVPGPVVDTSSVRIKSGALTDVTVCQQVARADAVLFLRNGRFGGLPGVRRCAAAQMKVTARTKYYTLYQKRH